MTVDAGSAATWVTVGSTGIFNASIPTGTTTADWYTASLTVAVPNDATANSLRFEVNYLNLVASGSIIDISQAMMQIGSVVAPFQRMSGTLQGELTACQRYYVRFNAGNGYGNVANSGYISTSTGVNSFVQFPVPLRAVPTSIDSSSVSWIDTTNTSGTASSPSAAAWGTNYANVAWTATGATAGRFCWFRDSAGAGTGYLGFSAEL